MRFFFRLLLALTVGLAGGYLGRKVFDRRENPTPKVNPVTAPVAKPPPETPVEKPVKGTKDKEPEPPFPTGALVRDHRMIVTMSDGTIRYQNRRFSENSDGISQISPSSVVLNGEKLFFKPLPRPVVAVGSNPHGIRQQEPQEETAQVAEDTSSWFTDKDGVQRIKPASEVAVRTMHLNR